MISASKKCQVNFQILAKYKKNKNDPVSIFTDYFLSFDILFYNNKIKNNFSQVMNNSQLCCFFPEAVTYPAFFNTNLVDPNRVLKVTTGNQSWARAFYYQLLKAIFELEMDDQKQVDFSVFLINYAKDTAKKTNNAIKSQKISHSASIVQNFIRNITNNPNIDFQNYINQNPIIDQSLIYILSQIILQTGRERDTSEEKIKYLGQIFQLQMHQFQKGIKIEESDTFLYIQDQSNVYIAFLSLSQFVEGEVTIERSDQKNDNTLEKVVNSMQKVNDQPVSYKKQSSVVQKFEINSIHHEKAHQGEQSSKNPQKYERQQRFQSIQSSVKNTKSDESLQFTLGNKKQNVIYKQLQKPQPGIKLLNSGYFLKHAETVEEQNQNESKVKDSQAATEHRVINNIYNQGKTVQMYKKQEDIFYKPEKKSSVNSPLNGKLGNMDKNRKDPFDLCNESEKGTFYRKFTDTRILNMLSEPYRSKVKMIKNRFIGVHSNNIKARDQREKY